MCVRFFFFLPCICIITHLCIVDVTDSRIQCLTWKIDLEKLRFICRIPNFSYAVSLFDSKGKLYVKCTFERYAQHCTPLVRNDSVVANFELNHVIFKTSGLHQDMNGEWICEHNNKRHTTYVSLSKGRSYCTYCQYLFLLCFVFVYVFILV